MSRVPVLVYHSISSSPHPLIRGYSVDERTFLAHLDAIVDRGLQALTMSDVARAIASGDSERLARTVAITFDDGFADVASTAAPALMARDLSATAFVTTGVLAGGGRIPLDRQLSKHMLDWSQLADLGNAGFEIGAHSHSHPQLDTLTPKRLREELDGPRRLLEDALGAPVSGIAYPHGYSSPRVRRLAHEAGYTYGCGVGQTFTGPGQEPFALSRLMLTSTHSPSTVERWLDLHGAPGARSRERVATMGWRIYRQGRAILRRAPGADDGWPGSRLQR